MSVQNSVQTLPEIISFIKQKDYKPLKWLGRGAFGTTVLLYDETIDEHFVCKKYEPLDGIDKEKYYKNFLDEIKIMYKLSHKNIVRVFNYHMYETHYKGYVIMEYIDGVNIREYLYDCPEMINEVFEQVIEGFSYLENKRVLHRDIRDTNILIDKGGFVKIIDFGFGKQILNVEDFDRSFSDLNWWCNIPNDFRHKIYDFKTEIYFIGQLFWKLISDFDIMGFKYNKLLSAMCEIEPKKRIESFDLIKRSIQASNNNDIEELFNEDEINKYQTFASAITSAVSSVNKNITYIDDIEEILKNLTDVHKKVMLENYIPQNLPVLRCFFEGAYRYKTKIRLETRILWDFIQLLKGCSKEKRNIVLNNLHSRFDALQRYQDDFIPEDEIPF